MTGESLQSVIARRGAILGVVGLLGFGTEVGAQTIPRDAEPVVGAYIPRELAMLPEYCKYTQTFRDNVPGGDDKTQIDHWFQVMGPTFNHMHHFCYGLMNATRAMLALDPQARAYYLHNSILEYDYVLRNATPGFILTPEVLTRKGESLVRMGRGPVGVESFEQAIELKPDYWLPYAQMSDYYKDSGNKEKAREMLQRGLAAIPQSKGLRQRLADLDAPEPADSKRATKAIKANGRSAPKSATSASR